MFLDVFFCVTVYFKNWLSVAVKLCETLTSLRKYKFWPSLISAAVIISRYDKSCLFKIILQIDKMHFRELQKIEIKTGASQKCTGGNKKCNSINVFKIALLLILDPLCQSIKFYQSYCVNKTIHNRTSATRFFYRQMIVKYPNSWRIYRVSFLFDATSVTFLFLE